VESRPTKMMKTRARRSGVWSQLNVDSELAGEGDLHSPRRIRIAEATAQDIVRNGLEGTSLKTIARRLNLTTGAIQHYFDSKETLLEFTKRHYLSQMLSRATEAYNGQRAARLLTLCELILPLTPERVLAWKVLLGFSGQVIGNSKLMSTQIDLYSQSIDIFSRAISAELRAGGRKGPIDCRTEALGLISLIEGLAYHIVFSKDGYKGARPLRLVARYVDVCLGAKWPRTIRK
jgi:AcrR family transcriptional regulator